MAASLEQQLAASKIIVARQKALLAKKDSTLSEATLRIKGLEDNALTLSKRVDSLIASVQVRPVEVHITDPLDLKDSAWDKVGVIGGVIAVPILIVIFTAYFSSRSAKQGAIIGGDQTRKASLEAIRTEWQLERQHALERMRQRIASNLIRLQLLREVVRQHKIDEPFDVSIGENLEVIWNLYYRVSDPIFAFTSEPLAERIDRLFGGAHNTAEEIKMLETQVRSAELQIDSAAESIRAHAPGRRKRAMENIEALAKEADALTTELGDTLRRPASQT